MAGMAGFEPTNARVKVWCLTAWRHPNLGPGFGHTGYYTTLFTKKQEENFLYFSFLVKNNARTTAATPPASFPAITAGSISGAKPAVKPR